MGFLWECVGHENTMKTHEIGGMNFHLKEWSRLGPTKLSIALRAEWGHRGAMPTTLPLISLLLFLSLISGMQNLCIIYLAKFAKFILCEQYITKNLFQTQWPEIQVL